MYAEPLYPDFHAVSLTGHEPISTSPEQDTRTRLHRSGKDRPQRKVLVLEDDPALQALLQMHLESLSVQTATASSICEARNLLEEQRFELGIFDIHLPDGSGLDLCSEIDEHPRWMGLPIIVLSSECDPKVVKRTRAAGGYFFLSKPYDPNVLLALIESGLGGQL